MFWKFIYKEHDDRPNQKNIAFVITKVDFTFVKDIISLEIAMLFYVVGYIAFWEFTHREHDNRPYQRALLLRLAKVDFTLVKGIISLEIAMLFTIKIKKFFNYW